MAGIVATLKAQVLFAEHKTSAGGNGYESLALRVEGGGLVEAFAPGADRNGEARDVPDRGDTIVADVYIEARRNGSLSVRIDRFERIGQGVRPVEPVAV